MPSALKTTNATVPWRTVSNSDNCPPNQAIFHRRRDFIKIAAMAGSLPLLMPTAFASIFSDERTAWYRNAKFGMFIHWGPYSLASVEASWPIMPPEQGSNTEAEYVEVPKRLKLEKCDARGFVD